jgi:hypothetical protein
MDLCPLQLLCAFFWVQEAMCHVVIVIVDFTLINFSGLPHFIDVSATQQRRTRIEIEGAKLEILTKNVSTRDRKDLRLGNSPLRIQ